MSAYEVFAVRYGTHTMARSEFFHNYSATGAPDGPIEMDYFFWVLRSAGETILVDCGFDTAAAKRRGRTPLIEPVEALRHLGVAPDEVSRIIVSHFHYDHVGNLTEFPKAVIHAQAREIGFWTNLRPERARLIHVTEPGELAYLARAAMDGRLQVTDGSAEIVPGVTVRLVGGHTPGQQIVLVGEGSGCIVLATDALHVYEEMERDLPFRIFTDLPGTFAAFDVLAELQAGGATVVAGHDPLVMHRFADIRGGDAKTVVRIA